MFPLLRYFSISSALVTVVVTVLLVAFHRHYETATMVAATEQDNIVVARAISNAIWARHGTKLMTMADDAPGDVGKRADIIELQRDVEQIKAGLPIIKAKIFLPDGLTVFSSVASDIGSFKTATSTILSIADFEKTIASGAPVSRMTFKDTLKIRGGALTDINVIATYIPVKSHAGTVVAVFEIYTDVSAAIIAIKRENWFVAILIFIAFTATYLCGLLIVRRADKELKQQHKRLQIELAERLTVEAELRSANGALETATKAKSDFLANMSHEIRTPMNGVFGIAALLKRTELTVRQRQLVDTMSGAASALIAIINDILDISRINSGKIELDCQEFDLHECVEATTVLLAEQASRKSISLSVFIDDRIAGIVKGDAGRLRQVLINLIGNAIKFTASGEVAIDVRPEEAANGLPRVGFEISDTGIGIAPEVLEKLFQPFSQADTSITRRFGGTGLGLAICRQLVALMGGTIKIESTLKQGTRVRFSLPLIGTSVPPAVDSGGPREFCDKRILAVGLSERTEKIVASYLGALGAVVGQAEDADQALTMLKSAANSGRHYAIVVVEASADHGSHMLAAHRESTAHEDWMDFNLIALANITLGSDGRSRYESRGGKVVYKPILRRDLVAAVAGFACGPTIAPGLAIAATRDCSKTPQLRVLVAEDNPVNQIVASEYLASLGCVVTMAENGAEAVELSGQQPFDVILMDFQMPIMDGLTATRQIRHRERNAGHLRIPILAMTANAFEEDRQAALDAGMDGYLSKPYTEEQLSAALQKWAPCQTARSVHEDALGVQETAAPVTLPPATSRKKATSGTPKSGKANPIKGRMDRSCCKAE